MFLCFVSSEPVWVFFTCVSNVACLSVSSGLGPIWSWYELVVSVTLCCGGTLVGAGLLNFVFLRSDLGKNWSKPFLIPYGATGWCALAACSIPDTGSRPLQFKTDRWRTEGRQYTGVLSDWRVAPAGARVTNCLRSRIPSTTLSLRALDSCFLFVCVSFRSSFSRGTLLGFRFPIRG